ncbi:MAG: cryptochrome/photolyase family protein [Gammaproteobacteria bacterium]|nr:MAG: cryptochrome/photolyase family protein [Gammaproteobacteria bacterium]
MTVNHGKAQYRTLRLILGDQLNPGHHWLDQIDPGVLYVIAELHQEATYVKHHVQKLCAFFAAMEEFAFALCSRGHDVLYLQLEETLRYDNLAELIGSICLEHNISRFEFQSPDEYRLRHQLRNLELDKAISVHECGSDHFLLPEAEFAQYLVAGKHNRLESFYRKMRMRLGLLMDGNRPLGGKWNYDDENRHRLRPDDLAEIPAPLVFDNNVESILGRIDGCDIEHFGEPVTSLLWPVNRAQALELLEYFCQHCLPRFGQFQDAMTCRHEYRWSLYHSRLSFALNSKMLHPMEAIDAAIARFETADGRISIAQIEGFVRQIIGWREYVRAVYWLNMPEYAELNYLHAGRDLPVYFWDGATRMNCMQHALGQSLEHAYAHHIQRLMIIGNFCLLAGVDPAQVDAWYLGVYIDAIEWVEMPNTRGMSQFADGGLIATKPYSAGGNYINRMSDYCKHCDYDVRQKSNDSACPFNSLYWAFMIRHREQLAANPRIGVIYRSWDRQGPKTQEATLSRADWCLQHLEDL